MTSSSKKPPPYNPAVTTSLDVLLIQAYKRAQQPPEVEDASDIKAVYDAIYPYRSAMIAETGSSTQRKKLVQKRVAQGRARPYQLISDTKDREGYES